MSATERDRKTRSGLAPVDRDRLAESLAAGETDLLKAHFEQNGGPVPRITWSPRSGTLGVPVLETFAAMCDGMATAEGFIRADELRIEDFDGLERWAMILTREGPHHRYQHYGVEIANHYGEDMTGRSTADFDNYIGVFFDALYTAAALRRERVLSMHEPPMHVFVRLWRRLIVPLVDKTGEISGFVGANVPDNELRAGLDMIVDPVIVTDRDGDVQHVNDAARSFFGVEGRRPRNIADIAGIDLGNLPAPEILLARRDVVERLELVARPGDVMDRLTVTISAAEHRQRAYYVIVLRTVSPG